MGVLADLRRERPLLALAVGAAVCFGAFMAATAIVRGDGMALPGAVIAFLLYSTLGHLALRGHEWARWAFFSIILLTALVCIAFTFLDLGTGSAEIGFTPGLALVSALYIGVAVASALPIRGRTR